MLNSFYWTQVRSQTTVTWICQSCYIYWLILLKQSTPGQVCSVFGNVSVDICQIFSSLAFISSLHFTLFPVNSTFPPGTCVSSQSSILTDTHQTDTVTGSFIHQHQNRFQHHTSYLSLFLHNQWLWWFWQIWGVLNISIRSFLYDRISVVLENHVD